MARQGKNILLWTFGVFFTLIGVFFTLLGFGGLIIVGDWSAIFLVLMGLALIPIVKKQLKFKTWHQIVACVACFVLFGIFISAQSEEEREKARQERAIVAAQRAEERERVKQERAIVAAEKKETQEKAKQERAIAAEEKARERAQAAAEKKEAQEKERQERIAATIERERVKQEQTEYTMNEDELDVFIDDVFGL